MKIVTWMKIAGFLTIVTLILGVAAAWRGVRREQAELRERLKSAEQELQAANARQASRKVETEKELAQIYRQKAAVKTPDQVLKALPDVLPLPKVIVLPHEGRRQAGQTEDGADRSKDRPQHDQEEDGSRKAAPNGDGLGVDGVEPIGPEVALPAGDLKPLYDFAMDCRACKTELAAAQADLADERTKTGALGRERDEALRVVRGGSVIRRVVRAAKWFALGAAAGAVAAKLAH